MKEQLIKIADNDPMELALLFARDIAGFSNPQRDDRWNDKIWGTMYTYAPDYLTDFTACFKAVEEKRIIWEKTFYPKLETGHWFTWYARHEDGEEVVGCKEEERWKKHPCIPFIISVLAVWYQMKNQNGIDRIS